MDPAILLPLGSITTDWVWLLIFTRFLDHTQRRTTVGRTPLNERSVRRRDLYLTTHNNHNRQHAEDFYLPLKIRRLWPGLNPRTWVPKASTLPLDHRSRYDLTCDWLFSHEAICITGTQVTLQGIGLCTCLAVYIIHVSNIRKTIVSWEERLYIHADLRTKGTRCLNISLISYVPYISQRQHRMC